MDNHPEQDQFIHQLFREQREQEAIDAPAFTELYAKAKQKHQKMKNIKISLLIGLALILLAGLAILTTDKDRVDPDMKVASAGFNYYQALETEGKFVINNIQFAFNRADLKPESMSIISTIAQMMADHPEVKLSVEGHTDAHGAASYNQELSGARAEAVRQALINRGVAADRLRSAGYGESKPVAENDSDAGRAKNRRVEFVRF